MARALFISPVKFKPSSIEKDRVSLTPDIGFFGPLSAVSGNGQKVRLRRKHGRSLCFLALWRLGRFVSWTFSGQPNVGSAAQR